MKKFFVTVLLLTGFVTAKTQTVESLHFHLYTDSLKKGVHNYINVDGKMSNGCWKPLTEKELRFEADYGKFEGNDLVLPENPSVKKVKVTVWLKDNPKKTETITIAIKQKPDPLLPTYDADAEMRGKRRKM